MYLRDKGFPTIGGNVRLYLDVLSDLAWQVCLKSFLYHHLCMVLSLLVLNMMAATTINEYTETMPGQEFHIIQLEGS